jgi:hypothetical protein
VTLPSITDPIQELPKGSAASPDGKYAPSQLPLDKGDEIKIYMGYADSIEEALSTIRSKYKDKDRVDNMLCVFTGSIDTITATGSSTQGISLNIQCRDRMKYLMDSLGSFNSADVTTPLVDQGDAKSVLRSQVILSIFKRAVGQLEGGSGLKNHESQCASVCGMKVKDGFILDVENNSSGTGLLSQAYAFYNGKEFAEKYKPPENETDFDAQSNKTLGGLTFDPEPNPSSFPILNVITGRLPYNTSEGLETGMQFQITDRVPLEYLRYLAMQEPWPTEVFQDQRSGELWYAPRGLDITSLEDPKRFNRTYYFRHTPAQDEPIHTCQMALVFREETSMIGWRSNIIVSNGTANTNSSVHLRVVPDWLRSLPDDKPKAHACTYYSILDPSATAPGTLAATAMMFARLMGRESRAAALHILGDPSITPGEAIQVIGSPLHPESYQAAEQDRKNALDYYKGYQELYQQSLQSIVGNTAVTNPNTGTTEEVPPTPPVASPGPLPSPTVPIPSPTPESTPSPPPPDDSTAVDPQTGAPPSVTDPENSAQDIPYVSSVLQSGKVTIKPMPAGAPGAANFCPAIFADVANPTSNQITFVKDPITIFRVEAVVHKYNDGQSGYQTEIALLSPF